MEYDSNSLMGICSSVAVLRQSLMAARTSSIVDSDSKWTSVVEGMTAYSPDDLKKLLDNAGFTQTEIHRKKPTYATIIGAKCLSSFSK